MQDTEALRAWRRRAGRHRRWWRWAGGGAPAIIALACGGIVTVRALAPAADRRASPTPAPACAAVQAAARADVDGDGCDEPVTFAAGVLVAGARRMRVGTTGDEVAVGRWTCSGATAALLRPATGEVFRFDGWATPDRTVRAMRVATVEGAVGIQAVAATRPECDDLGVLRATGLPVVVWRAP